jgi:predicted enzyme involved in methoxymalonyl-ACP biosynthesis
MIVGIVCVDEKWGIGKNNDLLFHLKKDMEFAMLDTVVEHAKIKGLRRIVGYYYPTSKNNMVRELYSKFGFTKIQEDEDGSTVWELLIDSYQKQNHV